MTTQQDTLNACLNWIKAREDATMLHHAPEHFAFALQRTGGSLQLSCVALEQGWITFLAQAVRYEDGLDAKLMLGLFEASWAFSVARFVLADEGLYLRADLPTGDALLSCEAVMQRVDQLAGAVDRLIAGHEDWLTLQDDAHTPPDLVARLEALGARWRDDAAVWLLDHPSAQVDSPVVVQPNGCGLRLLYGVDRLDAEPPPHLVGTLLRLNDTTLQSRFLLSNDGAIVMALDIGPSELAYAMEHLIARFCHDVDASLTLLTQQHDPGSALTALFDHIETGLNRAGLDDAVLASALSALIQGDALPQEVEVDDALADTIVELGEFMFRVLPQTHPQALALLPMQLDLMARGAQTHEGLRDLLIALSGAPPEPEDALGSDAASDAEPQ